jgi:hypothetical protein
MNRPYVLLVSFVVKKLIDRDMSTRQSEKHGWNLSLVELFPIGWIG